MKWDKPRDTMNVCFQDTLVDASLQGKPLNVAKSVALVLVPMISAIHFNLTQAQVIAFERGQS